MLGIPLAVWFVVRSQFLAQAVVLEGCDGRRGLARSAALVSGRWWSTAVVVGAVNAVLSGLGVVVGLVLLVALPSLPLWTLSFIVTACNVAVLPLGAIAVTLLYGDAVAEERTVTAAAVPAPS